MALGVDAPLRRGRSIRTFKHDPNSLNDWMAQERRDLGQKLESVRKGIETITPDIHVFSLLSEENFEQLHTKTKELTERVGYLTQDDFMPIVEDLIRGSLARHLKEEEETYLQDALSQLFQCLDMDGNGTLQWNEFESHLLNSYVMKDQELAHKFLPYDLRTKADLTCKPLQLGSKLSYIPALDNYLAINVHGDLCHSTLSIINPEAPLDRIENETEEKLETWFKPQATVSHNVSYLAAQYIPTNNMVMASTCDNRLHYYQYFPERSAHDPRKRLKLAYNSWVESPINCSIWDDEAQELFGGNRDGDVMLFDLSSDNLQKAAHTPVFELRCHTGIINDMIALPGLNPKRVATAGMDGFCKMIDVERQKTVYEFGNNFGEIHRMGINQLSYSPDYMFIVTTGCDFEPTLWMPVHLQHKHVAKLYDHEKPHRHQILATKCVKGTPQIISADISGLFKIWDIRMGLCLQNFDVLQELDRQERDLTKTIDFMVDPKREALVTLSTHVYNHISSVGMHTQELPKKRNAAAAHDSRVSAVCYDTVSNSFFTAAGNDIKVWDAKKGTVLLEFKDAVSSQIVCMDIDVSGRKLITATNGGNVQSHNLASGAILNEYAHHKNEVTFLFCDSSNRAVFSAAMDGILYIYDADGPRREARPSKTISLGVPIVKGLYSWRTRLLLLADANGNVAIYDREPTLLYRCLTNTPLGVVNYAPNMQIDKTSSERRQNRDRTTFGSVRPGSSQSDRDALQEVHSPKSGGSRPASAQQPQVQVQVNIPQARSAELTERPGDKTRKESEPDGPLLFDEVEKKLTMAANLSTMDPAKGQLSCEDLEAPEMNYVTDSQMDYYNNDPAPKAVALCFLHSYPAFVVADTQFSYTLWTFRPEPYVAAAKWKAFKPRDSKYPGLTTDMQWHSSTCCLYAADDSGFITVWNMRVTLDNLKSYIGNIQDSKEISNMNMQPVLQFCWKAHGRAISCLRLIPNTSAIVTCSSDSHVYLWSLIGEFLGALEQGIKHQDGISPRNYNHQYTFRPGQRTGKRTDVYLRMRTNLHGGMSSRQGSATQGSSARETPESSPRHDDKSMDKETLRENAEYWSELRIQSMEGLLEREGSMNKSFGASTKADFLRNYALEHYSEEKDFYGIGMDHGVCQTVSTPPSSPMAPKVYNATHVIKVKEGQKHDFQSDSQHSLGPQNATSKIKPQIRPGTAPAPFCSRSRTNHGPPVGMTKTGDNEVEEEKQTLPPVVVKADEETKQVLMQIGSLFDIKIHKGEFVTKDEDLISNRGSPSPRNEPNVVAALMSESSCMMYAAVTEKPFMPPSNDYVAKMIKEFKGWTATYSEEWLSKFRNDEFAAPPKCGRPVTAPISRKRRGLRPKSPYRRGHGNLSSRTGLSTQPSIDTSESELTEDESMVLGLSTEVEQVVLSARNYRVQSAGLDRTLPVYHVATKKGPTLSTLLQESPNWPLNQSPFLSLDRPPSVGFPKHRAYIPPLKLHLIPTYVDESDCAAAHMDKPNAIYQMSEDYTSSEDSSADRLDDTPEGNTESSKITASVAALGAAMASALCIVLNGQEKELKEPQSPIVVIQHKSSMHSRMTQESEFANMYAPANTEMDSEAYTVPSMGMECEEINHFEGVLLDEFSHPENACYDEEDNWNHLTDVESRPESSGIRPKEVEMDRKLSTVAVSTSRSMQRRRSLRNRILVPQQPRFGKVPRVPIMEIIPDDNGVELGFTFAKPLHNFTPNKAKKTIEPEESSPLTKNDCSSGPSSRSRSRDEAMSRPNTADPDFMMVSSTLVANYFASMDQESHPMISSASSQKAIAGILSGYMKKPTTPGGTRSMPPMNTMPSRSQAKLEGFDVSWKHSSTSPDQSYMSFSSNTSLGLTGTDFTSSRSSTPQGGRLIKGFNKQHNRNEDATHLSFGCYSNQSRQDKETCTVAPHKAKRIRFFSNNAKDNRDKALPIVKKNRTKRFVKHFEDNLLPELQNTSFDDNNDVIIGKSMAKSKQVKNRLDRYRNIKHELLRDK